MVRHGLYPQVAQQGEASYKGTSGQDNARDIKLTFCPYEIKTTKPGPGILVVNRSFEPPILGGDSRSLAVRHHPWSSDAATRSGGTLTEPHQGREISSRKGATLPRWRDLPAPAGRHAEMTPNS